MSERPFTDSAKLKEEVSLHQVMQMLSLQLKQAGAQFRGCCPVHGGGPRTLVVTPGKGFFCFASSKGGDQIQLVSHVRECAPREAAEQISKYFCVGEPAPASAAQRQPAPASAQSSSAMDPLTPLEPDPPAVEAVGFDAEVAEAAGIGDTGK